MKRIKTLSAGFFWIEAAAATIFFVLFILDWVHRDLFHALPYLSAATLVSSCVIAIGDIRKEADKTQLTDHIEVSEKPLPTEVAALQELVRKYESLLASSESYAQSLVKNMRNAEDCRIYAEEEMKKKDFQIYKLMENNQEYLTERDNLYKELTALKSSQK